MELFLYHNYIVKYNYVFLFLQCNKIIQKNNLIMNQLHFKITFLFLFAISTITIAQTPKIELIKDIDTSFYINGVSPNTPMISYNNKIYFRGSVKSLNYELWVSDGTNDGTKLIKEFRPGNLAGNPSNFIVKDGKLYFTAIGDNNLTQLWVSDGTEIGTIPLKIIPAATLIPPNINIIEFKNKIWVTETTTTSVGGLYYSDGTENGTKLFTGKDTTKALIKNAKILAATDSMMYLIGEIVDSGFGIELIKTDGTVEGTKVINDFIEGPNGSESNPFGFVITDRDLYYIAYSEKLNPPTKIGTQLWKSNGTAEGSKVIKDLNVQNDVNRLPVFDYSFSKIGNYIYFNRYNEINGAVGELYNLWRTDGTEQGTIKVEKDSGLISLGFVSYDNNMYYLNGTKKHEIWKTDGINKKFVYKSGFFDEKQTLIKSYIINNKLYYLYTDKSGKPNYSDFVEIFGDTARSIVNDIPKFENIYDIEKVGNTLFLKIQTSDKGVELYKMTFTTSIDEIREIKQLSIYPNPTTNDFTFNAKNEGELLIYNLSGQKIYSQKINTIGEININPKLENGMYYMNYITKGEIYQNKLMISK